MSVIRWASLVSVVHLSLWSADVEMRSTSVGDEAAQVLLLSDRKQTVLHSFNSAESEN